MTETAPRAAQNRPLMLAGRVRRSFLDSVGSIVFGMEDGTIGIAAAAAIAGLAIGKLIS